MKPSKLLLLRNMNQTPQEHEKSVSAFKPFWFSSVGVKANLSSTPASQIPHCPCGSTPSSASQADHHLRRKKENKEALHLKQR